MSIIAAIDTFLANAQIVSIPEHKNEDFQKFMVSLAKKAKKLGVDAPTAKLFSATTMAMPKWKVVRVFCPVRNDYVPTQRLVDVPCYVYLIDGVTPRVNSDYELCARVDFEDGLILVNTAPGAVVPARYRSGTNTCDHCGKVRNRKSAYVLKATATGEYTQVGGQCLVDFIGKASVKALAGSYELLESLASIEAAFGEGDEEIDTSWGNSRYTNTVAYVGCVLQVIANQGMYVSKSKCFSGFPTSELAEQLYMEYRRDKKPVPNQAEAESMIARAMVFLNAKGVDDLSDYEHNLKGLLSTTLFRKGHGYVASVVPFVRRAEGIVAERKVAAVSEFVGTVGKRTEFVLTHVATHEFESEYGVVRIHRLKDENGNVFVWKSGNDIYRIDDKGQPLQDSVGCYVSAIAGDVFKVKATVKGHDTYRDNKQTTLSRVAVLEMVSAA